MGSFWKGLVLVSVLVKIQLPGSVDEEAIRRFISQDAVLKGAHVGVMLKEGNSQLSINGDKRFIPASVTKLVTTALALEALGKDFHFATKAAMDGAIEGGILKGNLYLIGGGDPSLNYKGIEGLARQVAAQGIREVKGGVFADLSLFGRETFPTDVEWADLQEGYAAEISPLTFNENVVTLLINKATGELHCLEDTLYCSLEGVLEAKEKDASFQYKRDFLANRVVVHGSISRGEGDEKIKIAVHSPSEYARQAWIKALNDLGIQVRFEDIKQGERIEIASVFSKPLNALLKEINHRSNNLYAETVLRYIAKKRYPTLPLEEAESQVLREYLERMGAKANDFVLREGAGLSRHNLLTPETVVNFLERKLASPEGEAFLSVLPTAGEEGTLQNRFKELDAGLLIKAKTGGMEGVANLAGIGETPSRKKILFCIFVNGSTRPHKETAASVDSLVLMLLRSYEENSANTRAGNPDAPLTLGKDATTMPSA